MDKKDFVLVLILLLSVILRFTNLDSIPHVQWDEGTNMELSWNIIHERSYSLFGVSFPFFYVVHPPLFFMASGFFMNLFGDTLPDARIFTASCGVFTTFLVYLVCMEFFSDRRISLTAGFLYAVYPYSVYWGRMNYANNLLAVLNLVSVYFFMRYLKNGREGRLAITGMLLGVSILTEFTTFILMTSFMIVLYSEGKKDKIPVLIIPPFIAIILFACVLFLLRPDYFLYDILHLMDRFKKIIALTAFSLLAAILAGAGRIMKLVQKILDYYAITISERNCTNILVMYSMMSLVLFLIPYSDETFPLTGIDFFWFAGLIGLSSIEKGRVRNFVFSFLLMYVVFMLAAWREDHISIPLHPYVAIGLALTITKLLGSFHGIAGVTRRFFFVLLVLYPILFVLYQDASMFISSEKLRHNPVEEIKEVVGFLNSNTARDDVVVGDGLIAHLADCNGATVFDSIAYDGGAISEYYPEGIDKNRFSFNASYKNARFIVATDLMLAWMRTDDHGRKILDSMEKGGWRKRRFGREYIVYENPAFKVVNASGS